MAVAGVPLSVLSLAPIPQGRTAADALRATTEQARRAEEWNYLRFWVAEHHNMPAVASSATSILIGHLAGATSRIRVGSGGVMLPNHAPYIIAEQFGTLATLYPDRIDLGLGRAPGTDPWTARALHRDPSGGLDFPDQVAELRGYLAPPTPGRRVRAIPGEGTQVPVWLLGSSLFSARLAAREGLPFAFASHFAPDQLHAALEVYRREFRPSAELDRPHAMAGLNVMVADTDERARYEFSSVQQRVLSIVRGDIGMPPPVADIDALWTPAEAQAVGSMLREAVVGAPGTVRRGLLEFVERTGADELIVVSEPFDPAARLRSLELLAELWEL
ncbi:LLM class flavin-dependent oxidoreductase [Actinomadura craniellae]|uniref:LLM class flavin-dependent oxidoreductase n=1 Tax=Actinomadura craniellae TaxID=2231787 RepID=A0A365HC72_9ACTN|nr:LLM class flavin-dependent oxidoreductase [Actinomadura craniellae]RAY15863.1 LLM class flavin-dependent oxidoreductase [Actinomadura craniellae]